jgi:hypothetical protein
VIDDSIGGALRQLFSGFTADVGDRVTSADDDGDPDTTTPDDTGEPGDSTEPDETADELLVRAEQLFDEADAALAQTPPDYATYGEKQTEARGLITRAIELLEAGS